MSEPSDRERVLSDAERARALLEQLKGVRAADVARDMALGLINFCSPKLGLSDETRPIRDLEDVRLSIELLRAIVGVLDAEGVSGGTHDLHDALAQLQLAYAHAVQLANAEQAAGPAAEAEAPAAGQAPAAAEEPAAEAGTEEGQAAEEKEPAAAEEPAEEPVAEEEPASEPAAEPAADERAAAGKKQTAKKKPAARKKPAAKKKPAGES